MLHFHVVYDPMLLFYNFLFFYIINPFFSKSLFSISLHDRVCVFAIMKMKKKHFFCFFPLVISL